MQKLALGLYLAHLMSFLPQSVSINAIYTFESELTPTFGIYYGHSSKQMVRVEFNFSTQQILFFEENDFGNSGIECSSDFGCEFTGEQEYVTEFKGEKYLKTSLAKIPVKLPQIMELENEIQKKLTFNLYQMGKYRIANVIGLGSKSRFWEYVSLKYQIPNFSIRLESNFKMNSVDQILQSYDQIYTKLQFFIEPNSTPGYRELLSNNIGFRSVKLVYGNISPLNKELVFSLNEPFIFKISPVDYLVLVEELKKEICPDPNQCESKTDLYGNLSGKSKLDFIFPLIDEFQSRKPFAVNFFVNELFYVNQQNKIAFNFGVLKLSSPKYAYSTVELGLLFLNKCVLEIGYSDNSKLLTLTISYKDFTKKQSVYFLYVCTSLFFSLLLVSLLAIFLGPSKTSSSQSYSNSVF